MSHAVRHRLAKVRTYQLEGSDDLFPAGRPLSDSALGTYSDLLDSDYLEFLSQCLTAQRSSLPSHLYQAKIDLERLEEIRGKAVSMYNEQLLSLRAHEAGLAVMELVLIYRSMGLLPRPARTGR